MADIKIYKCLELCTTMAGEKAYILADSIEILQTIANEFETAMYSDETGEALRDYINGIISREDVIFLDSTLDYLEELPVYSSICSGLSTDSKIYLFDTKIEYEERF